MELTEQLTLMKSLQKLKVSSVERNTGAVQLHGTHRKLRYMVWQPYQQLESFSWNLLSGYSFSVGIEVVEGKEAVLKVWWNLPFPPWLHLVPGLHSLVLSALVSNWQVEALRAMLEGGTCSTPWILSKPVYLKKGQVLS